jgi:hypothetical protein
MKYLILLLALTACAKTRVEVVQIQSESEKVVCVYENRKNCKAGVMTCSDGQQRSMKASKCYRK